MDRYDSLSVAGFAGVQALSFSILYKNKRLVNKYCEVSTLDVSKLYSPDMERVRFTESRDVQNKIFKGVPAILITTTVFAIGNIVANEMLWNNTNLLEFIKKPSNMSLLIPFIFKNNPPRGWGKLGLYFFSLLLVGVILLLLIKYFSVIWGILKSFRVLWLKYGIACVLGAYILYQFTTISLLIQYSVIKDEEIHISKYLPKVIQKYLFELKEISKFKILNQFLAMHLRMGLFVLVFLILVLFILNLLF